MADISMTDLDFLTSGFNQWLSLILWASASVLAWYGARRGMAKHLVPRVVLAMGCTILAGSYALDLILGPDSFNLVLNIRRASGWIVAIGIGWSAWTGIAAGREMDYRVEEYTALIVERIEQDRIAEEESRGRLDE